MLQVSDLDAEIQTLESWIPKASWALLSQYNYRKAAFFSATREQAANREGVTNPRIVIALYECLKWLGEYEKISFAKPEKDNRWPHTVTEALSEAGGRNDLQRHVLEAMHGVIARLYESTGRDYKPLMADFREKHHDANSQNTIPSEFIWPDGEINMFSDGQLFEVISLLLNEIEKDNFRIDKMEWEKETIKNLQEMKMNTQDCVRFTLDVLRVFHGGVVKAEDEDIRAVKNEQSDAAEMLKEALPDNITQNTLSEQHVKAIQDFLSRMEGAWNVPDAPSKRQDGKSGKAFVSAEDVHDFITLYMIRGLDARLGVNNNEYAALRSVLRNRVRSRVLELIAFYTAGVNAKSDPIELAFSITLLDYLDASASSKLMKRALEIIAETQREDGSWPVARLITYEKRATVLQIASYEVALILADLLCKQFNESRPLSPETHEHAKLILRRPHVETGVG